MRGQVRTWGWLALAGAVNVLIGVMALAWPHATVLVLSLLLGLQVLAFGAFLLGAAFLLSPADTAGTVAEPRAAGRPSAALRRVLVPLALAQFICSFAGSNMNVMINDMSQDLDTTVQGIQVAITHLPAGHGRADDPRRQADRPVRPQAAASPSGWSSTASAR